MRLIINHPEVSNMEKIDGILQHYHGEYDPEDNWKLDPIYDPMDNWKVESIYETEERINKRNNTCRNCENQEHLVEKGWKKNPINIRKKQQKRYTRIRNKLKKLNNILYDETI